LGGGSTVFSGVAAEGAVKSGSESDSNRCPVGRTRSRHRQSAPVLAELTR
jgi:hypothetical protein